MSEKVEIRAPAETAFAYIDDIRNLGWHMTSRSSMAMMESRLRLEILSDQATGLGATYRYSGTIMGLAIDFSESVTKYVPPREKVWRTIGEPRLLIIASYEMRVAIEPLSRSLSRLTISIVYELPRSAFWGRGPDAGSTIQPLVLAPDGPGRRACARSPVMVTA